jgi:hypothetical protein
MTGQRGNILRLHFHLLLGRRVSSRPSLQIDVTGLVLSTRARVEKMASALGMWWKSLKLVRRRHSGVQDYASLGYRVADDSACRE